MNKDFKKFQTAFLAEGNEIPEQFSEQDVECLEQWLEHLKTPEEKALEKRSEQARNKWFPRNPFKLPKTEIPLPHYIERRNEIAFKIFEKGETDAEKCWELAGKCFEEEIENKFGKNPYSERV